MHVLFADQNNSESLISGAIDKAMATAFLSNFSDIKEYILGKLKVFVDECESYNLLKKVYGDENRMVYITKRTKFYNALSTALAYQFSFRDDKEVDNIWNLTKRYILSTCSRDDFVKELLYKPRDYLLRDNDKEHLEKVCRTLPQITTIFSIAPNILENDNYISETDDESNNVNDEANLLDEAPSTTPTLSDSDSSVLDLTTPQESSKPQNTFNNPSSNSQLPIYLDSSDDETSGKSVNSQSGAIPNELEPEEVATQDFSSDDADTQPYEQRAKYDAVEVDIQESSADGRATQPYIKNEQGASSNAVEVDTQESADGRATQPYIKNEQGASYNVVEVDTQESSEDDNSNGSNYTETLSLSGEQIKQIYDSHPGVHHTKVPQAEMIRIVKECVCDELQVKPEGRKDFELLVVKILKWLVDNGADINTTCPKTNESLLFPAIKFQNNFIQEWLYRLNIDITIRNKSNQTAFDKASDNALSSFQGWCNWQFYRKAENVEYFTITTQRQLDLLHKPSATEAELSQFPQLYRLIHQANAKDLNEYFNDSKNPNVFISDEKDHILTTPLIYAIEMHFKQRNNKLENMDIILKLLIHGSDPNAARSKNNLTPLIALCLSTAPKSKLVTYFKLLHAAGAKVTTQLTDDIPKKNAYKNNTVMNIINRFFDGNANKSWTWTDPSCRKIYDLIKTWTTDEEKKISVGSTIIYTKGVSGLNSNGKRPLDDE